MNIKSSSSSQQQFPMSPFNTQFDTEEQFSNLNQDKGSRKAYSQQQSDPRSSSEAKQQMQSMKIQPNKEVLKGETTYEVKSIQDQHKGIRIISSPQMVNQKSYNQVKEQNSKANSPTNINQQHARNYQAQNVNWKGQYSFRMPENVGFSHQGYRQQQTILEPPRIIRQNERMETKYVNQKKIVTVNSPTYPQQNRVERRNFIQTHAQMAESRPIDMQVNRRVVSSKPVNFQESVQMRSPPIIQSTSIPRNVPSPRGNQIIIPHNVQFNFNNNQKIIHRPINAPQAQPINQSMTHHQVVNKTHQIQNMVNPMESKSSAKLKSIWQDKFNVIYQKFIWFIEKHQLFRKEISYLNQQLDLVNSEEEWIQLKRRHAELLDRFIEVEEELVNVIRLNRELLEKNQTIQDHQRKESSDNIESAKRFQELLSSFHMLQQQYNKLRERNDAIRELQNHYAELNQQFTGLQRQYDNVCAKLQQAEKQNNSNRSQNQGFTSEQRRKLQSNQKYILQLQQYIKQIENEHVNLQSEVNKKYSTNARGLDNQQVQKLTQKLKQKDVQFNKIKKEIKIMGEKYDEELGLKDQEIQSLKNNLKSQQAHHKDQLQDQILQLQSQIKNSVVNLQKRTRQLQDQLKKTLYQKQQMQNNLQSQIQSLNQQLDRKNNQSQKIFKELQQKITMLEDEVKKKATEKDSTMKTLNNRIAQLEDELTRKNYEIIRPLSDKNIKLEEELNQKTIQLSKHRQGNQYIRHEAELKKLIQSQEYKNQEYVKMKKERDRIFQQYENLHQEYQNIMIQFNKKKMEITTLKRQVGQAVSFERQIKGLNDILQKKNQQIFQLKTSIIQLNSVNADYQATNITLERLNQTIKNKNKQITTLKQANINLEQTVREFSLQASKPRQPIKSPQQFNEEIDYLKNMLNNKDQQFLKIRQTLQLKDSNIEEMQIERGKLKNKIALLQKNINDQREQWKIKTRNIQNEAQRRLRQYQDSSNNSKNSTEQQLNSTKNQLKLKNDAISFLENNEKDFKNKLSNLQKAKNNLQEQISLNNRKIKDLQNANKEIIRKNESLVQDIQSYSNKVQQLISIDSLGKQQIKNAKSKSMQLETSLRSKEVTIKSIEQQLKQANEKNKILKNEQENQKNKYIQQIQDAQSRVTLLNQKIISYENKFINMHQFNNIQYKMKDFSANQVFESKIIYELKTQNQRLRKTLGSKGLSVNEVLGQYKQRNTSKSQRKHKNSKDQNGDQEHEQSKRQITQENEQGFNYIQKRLHDFNSKLQELMTQNKQTQLKGSKVIGHLPNNHEQIQTLLSQFQNQKQVLLHKHKNQINLFKIRIQQLQKYCIILQQRIRKEKPSSSTLKNNNKVSLEQQNLYAEQLTFFKEKNKELESRVDKHIEVNNQLKQKLELLIKNGGNNSSILYFKEQIQTLQTNEQNLNLKIKKLSEENRQLKTESLDKSSKNIEHYDYKSVEIQSKLLEANRKISQLNMQNSNLQNEKSNLINQMNTLNSELYRLKSTPTSKATNNQDQVRYYEQQLARLNNKTKILQSQIQRLGEQSQLKTNQADVQKLKNKILELQDFITNYQIQVQNRNREKLFLQQQIKRISGNSSNSNNFQATLEREISNLRNIIGNLQRENQSLTNEINRINNDTIGMRNEIMMVRKVIDNIRYNLELIRSCYFVIESIFGELKLKDKEEIVAAQRLGQNVGRGLDACQQIGNLISSL